MNLHNRNRLVALSVPRFPLSCLLLFLYAPHAPSCPRGFSVPDASFPSPRTHLHPNGPFYGPCIRLYERKLYYSPAHIPNPRLRTSTTTTTTYPDLQPRYHTATTIEWSCPRSSAPFSLARNHLPFLPYIVHSNRNPESEYRSRTPQPLLEAPS